MNAKRIRAFALALTVFLSSVVPVRPSYAVVPLVGLAVAAVSNTGAIVTADLLTTGVTALIGGTIAALAITPNNADAPIRIPLASDKPTIDQAMPPPSAAPTVAATQQSPTARCSQVLATLGSTSTVNGCTVTSTLVSNGIATYANQYYACGYSTVRSSSNCPEYATTIPNGSYQFYQAQPNVSCGAGYVQSGSSCVLQNARAAASDGKADLIRTASGYSIDGSEADTLPAYARVAGGKVYAQGVNSSGKPVMIEYAVSPDGNKTYITHYTQTEDSAQTVVKSQSITVDASGTVTNAGATSAVGSISPATGANSVPVVSTGAAVTSGAQSGSDSIVFPTDYARTGEAGLAANTVKSAIDALKDAPTVENPDITTPTTSTVTDAFYGANNKIIGLLGWHVPAFVSECPVANIQFDWNLVSFHGRLDSQCSVADQVRPTAAVIFDALWVLLAFFIVLGA